MCTPAASILSSLSTMIRSSAATGWREWKLGPVGAMWKIGPSSRAGSRRRRAIRWCRPSGSSACAAAGRRPLRGSSESAASATAPTNRDACRSTRSGRSPISSSAMTAPRGSKSRQVDHGAIDHADVPLHEERIAVPAHVARVDLEQCVDLLAAWHPIQHAPVLQAEIDRPVEPVIVDQFVRDCSAAPAKALVRFLQSDDVGIDLMQHVEHTLRIAATVGADSLAHIVAGDGDRRRSSHGAATPGLFAQFLKRPGSRR